MDIDLVAESEAIRYHQDRLKRYMLRMFHQSVDTIYNSPCPRDALNFPNMQLSHESIFLSHLVRSRLFQKKESYLKVRKHLIKRYELYLYCIFRGTEAIILSHEQELKRCQFEERSRFYRDLPCLNGRYLHVHISMLGCGGFSEVWKALDMLELKEVAIKVHQLNPSWTEDRKSSYIKHVTREYTIHRDLKHIRVV
jgi:hypothetical protein